MEYCYSLHHTCKSNPACMMNFKNDLYKSEWLELVFAGRNKAYGAYELRQHNSLTTLKALITGSLLIISGISGPFIYSKFIDNLPQSNLIKDDPKIQVVQLSVLPRIKPPEGSKIPRQEIVKMPTRKFVSLIVGPAPEVTDEMPSVQDLKDLSIAQGTVEGQAVDGVSNSHATGVNGQGAEVISTEDKVVNMEMLESYPEFPGGQAAFSKFIGRNLRYPNNARENQISGRVFLSFIIEKDGTLSNIKILREIGGGCEEEAIRVLKKSPAWSSGIQNGRKVRVQYTMPINFQLAE
jgi:protein TonB